MKVLPNLGAEEGLSPSALPPTATEAVRAFLWLFGPDVEPIDAARPAWPAALGPPPQVPLFDWIEGEACAWLADDAAQRRLRATGAKLHLPDPAVVLRVNDKAFAQRAALHQGLLPTPLLGHVEVFGPEAIEPERVRRCVEALPAWVGRDWVLKPRHGTSGRGRVRRLQDVAGSAARLRQRGGAVFEPWLRRIEDLSALLFLEPDGRIRWIGTTRQKLRGAGIYQGSGGELGVDGKVRSGSAWDDALRVAAILVAGEVSAAGYHGPLGIDAFVFEGPDGAPLLRPVVEINARFTMGMVAVGLLLQARRAGVIPGPCAWIFSMEGAEEGAQVLRLGEDLRLGWTPLQR